ncbi:MAG: ParB/RepB/Spo0J family partition protein [Burkholderiaceae bacterium]
MPAPKSAAARKPKGLGRGLEALLGEDPATLTEDPAAPAGAPVRLPLEALQAGRYQPRTRMDESALQELASSISQHGIMQPIVVRPLGEGRYEIIAGERRFRAARLAGLEEVPVLVREVSDQNALAMALIENIQREDLNPLEEAQAIRRLIDEFSYTHEQAAEAIGRSRSATSNLLRLLNLAPAVQTMLLAGDLEMGHARALLALDRGGQVLQAHQAVERRMTVREVEQAVQAMLDAARRAQEADSRSRLTGASRQDGSTETGPRGVSGGLLSKHDPDLLRLQERIANHLGASVRLKAGSRGRGELIVKFDSIEQFEGLRQTLGLTDERLAD